MSSTPDGHCIPDIILRKLHETTGNIFAFVYTKYHKVCVIFFWRKQHAFLTPHKQKQKKKTKTKQEEKEEYIQ